MKTSSKKTKKGSVKITKSKKPRALVLAGYGLNCEEETAYAFQCAGAHADIAHINDLIEAPAILERYDILAFPGGFSYGDDTGSGKAYANKIKNHLKGAIEEFVARKTLVIGICNGFQIITNLGLLPGALAHNDGAQYIDRWVDLTAVGKSPWLAGVKKISLPIAHGEGKYIIDAKTYAQMKKNKEIAFTYSKGEVCAFQNLPANPNGAMHDIAGVLGHQGRVLGMMPHPERALFFHHQIDWTKKRDALKAKKKKIPEFGPGFVLFQNAVKFFKKG